MIVVRQLGNGGAFNFDQPNTAFTLFNDQILVDCGHSIFRVLMEKEIASKIKYVFITHIHDDHIGSLGTFLYWKEFIDRKKVKVFLPPDAYDILLHKNWFGAGKFEYPNKRVDFEFLEFNPISSCVKLENDVWVRSLRQQTHGEFYNTSYSFDIPVSEDLYVRVVISGDTKANKDLQRFATKPGCKEFKALIVFHDFSNYNHPNNVHATAYDLELVYDAWFQQHIVKVHTGDRDFKEVYTLEDLKQFKL